MRILLSFFILSLSSFEAWAAVATPELRDESFLAEFKSDSKAAIQRPVKKYGDPIDRIALEEKIDACRQFDSRDAVMRSSGFRPSPQRQMFQHRPQHHMLNSSLSPSMPQNQYQQNLLLHVPVEQDTLEAKHFLELAEVVDKIDELDAFQEGRIDAQPWSGDYWAIRTGITAKRYLDESFPGSVGGNTWQEAFDYFIANPPAKVARELLAPSEKYDRLVRDERYTLTQISWMEGKQYNDEHGDVEKWMGICHGWAPAAFMEPRPIKSIEVAAFKKSATEETENLIFLPDDLKALASLKWANGVTVKKQDLTNGTRFIGGRCNTKDPETDPDTGRIIDADCFDLNPALWHIIVINQIAREKRSFVIDANYDYEVWNQPVTAYKMSYFNPKTLEPVEKLNDARVRLEDPEFTDQFKKFRNTQKAVEVVGVRMAVSYVVETSPRGRDSDSESHDAIRTAQYHYDLEIDSEGRVVGGEWYQNRHPDFIWMPVKDAVALNVEDLRLQNESQIVHWAPEASQSRVPLRYVLDVLMQQASTP
jgi:hypothetical protein